MESPAGELGKPDRARGMKLGSVGDEAGCRRIADLPDDRLAELTERLVLDLAHPLLADAEAAAQRREREALVAQAALAG